MLHSFRTSGPKEIGKKHYVIAPEVSIGLTMDIQKGSKKQAGTLTRIVLGNYLCRETLRCLAGLPDSRKILSLRARGPGADPENGRAMDFGITGKWGNNGLSEKWENGPKVPFLIHVRIVFPIFCSSPPISGARQKKTTTIFRPFSSPFLRDAPEHFKARYV